MKEQNEHCRKTSYKKVGNDLKLVIIEQIQNAQISNNHASNKYQVSRASIYYWLKKSSTLEQKKQGMSKKDEIKKLKEKIEELEFVKDFQQDIIADMELITGVDMSKKVIAQNISRRNRKKEAKPFKRKWLIQCFGVSKQAFYKRLKSHQTRQIEQQLIIRLIKEYRSQYGLRTGGIKLYQELKADMDRLGIKMGRDRFYRIMRMNNLLLPKLNRFHITTDSKHRFFKYKNLVKDKVPTRPEQLWVSDITYIKTQNGHSYLALVTDAYSNQIMGYKLASHMKISLCIDALRMAIKNRKYKNQKLILHSIGEFSIATRYTPALLRNTEY